MLVVRDFRKAYHDILILQFKELILGNGIYWFKGKNGSGKSTLFKSLAGLQPFEGSAEIDNIDIRKQGIDYRKLVNYAEAEPLYPGFITAKDLVRFVGKAKNSSRDQQEFYTKLFGIDSYFEKTCETFSSGMLKKLSLTAAFLGNPRMIILDEPLITLDDGARKTLLDHIREIAKEKIFLLSSHQELDESQLKLNSIFRIENHTLTQ